MSTTLTNGLKLPDKGSVDWYADMQNNYTILDGAVGTIAEHTSALASKAPLVHTHTKSDITDFPAYGTTAGTICEGNDSRLSDARTPVAHTHVTADVTDLLNTAHEWTKAQTYSDVNAIIIKNTNIEIGNEPSAYNEQRFLFRDKNNQQIAAIKYQNQLSSNNFFNNSLEFSATDKFKDGVRDATGTAITTVLRIGLWNDGTKYIYNDARWRNNLLPFTNNFYDLGSSSYQWNNLYAKNYYYNGVAWGLDKDNHWKRTQVLNTDTIIDIVNNPSNELVGSALYWQDNTRFWAQWVPVWGTDGSFRLELGISNYYSNGSQGYWTIVNKISKDFGTFDFYTTHGTANLGTSTYKWKSLNGINPGALSLPSGDSDNINTINWDFSWNANYVTAPFDGYISIACFGSALQINNETKSYAMTFAPGADGYICGLLPVSAGDSIKVLVTRTQTSQYEGYKFIKSRGNVS